MRPDRRLPKSFWHWCKLAGIHPSSHRDKIYQCWSAKGRGWRVNCLREFQSSERWETFDRWANSLNFSAPIPQSKDEFLNTVKKMMGDRNDIHKKENRD